MTNYDLSTPRICRKVVRFAVAAIFTLVVPLSTVGCIQFGSGEYYFEPSPSGNFVASLLEGGTYIMPAAPEVITLSQSAKFRLRRSEFGLLGDHEYALLRGVRPSNFKIIPVILDIVKKCP